MFKSFARIPLTSRFFGAVFGDGHHIIARDPMTDVVTWEEWYENGKLHREDGPAVILRDGETGEVYHQSRYLNGREVTFSDKPLVQISCPEQEPK